MFNLREYQRRRLDTLESLPMFGAHAHRHDVIRGAEENRENAKGRKRETDGEEYPAPRGGTRQVGSQPTVALPFFAISPFRVFAILFPKASHDIQVKGTPAAEVGTLESLPMFDAHAHRGDVIRGAEEDRESAKGRKRETDGEEYPAPRGRR